MTNRPRPRWAGTIHVCSLADLADESERVRPAHVVSILDPDHVLAVRPRVDRARHLILRFHDIEVPLPGYLAPEPEHIKRLIGFGRACGDQDPLLVHCHAGISRSPAAAFILMCLHNDGREPLAARVLRQQGRHVSPNHRMVELADEALGRAGRLVSALREMPPPAPTLVAQPVTLPALL